MDTHSQKVTVGIKDLRASTKIVFHNYYDLLLDVIAPALCLSLKALKVVVCYIPGRAFVGLDQQPFSSLKVS